MMQPGLDLHMAGLGSSCCVHVWHMGHTCLLYFCATALQSRQQMILQWNVSCAQPYSRAKPSMAHICTRTAMGKGNNLCLAQAQARNVYWFKWPHNHILCRLYSSESWDVFCINKIVSGCIVSARLPLTVLWFCMPGRFPKVVSTGLCC